MVAGVLIAGTLKSLSIRLTKRALLLCGT